MRNLHIRDLIVGAIDGAQATDTTEAISIIAMTDSSIDLTSQCVVAINAFSGKNLDIKVNHVNTDVANVTGQNGIIIKGDVINATVRDAVLIGDEFVVIDVTCDVFKGMLFEYSGTTFEFTGHARFDAGTPANNIGVKVPISAAPIGIPATSVIEQWYGIYDTVIRGRIHGMAKGVKLQTAGGHVNDRQTLRNITIDCEFEGNLTSDIEVPDGIVIKRYGVHYYNDNGAAMTFVEGVPAQTTIISYQEIGKNKVGRSAAAPVATWVDWIVGDILTNNTDPSTGVRCTVAGAPGTWVAF